MADDVIKNPHRSMPRTQSPYEPNYIRKDINLKEVPVKNVDQDTDLDNMFVAIDGTNVDNEGNDIPFDNGHIIDNNDYVNYGYKSSPDQKNKQKPEPIQLPKIQETEENVTSPQVGDYILMVLGKLITSGSIEKIEEKVKDIMYGDDIAFSGLEVSIDDIVVLKRVSIKVGIFVDE